MRLRSRKPLKKQVYRGDAQETPPPELMAIFDKYRGQADALITLLEEIQHHYGYLSKKNLEFIAQELDFPLSQIYGVVTFYNFFQLTPPGRYQVRVCKGTACHVGHSEDILNHLQEKLGIAEGETTPDKLFTLQTVACVGACSLAPVVVVNERTYARITPADAWDALEHLRDETGD